jgi:hypothetical protein
MNLKPWTLLALLILALLAGFLLCKAMSHPHSNTLSVDVEDGTGRINLAPSKGDVINWTKQSDGKPVTVHFTTGSPCEQSGDTDTCKINVSGGNFEYICDAATPCVDPGVDPRTNSAGSGGGGGQGVVTTPGTSAAIASIACSQSPAVTWNPSNSVNVGQNIVFKGGSLDFTVSGFNVGGTPVQLCSQATINQNNRTCSVVQDGSQTPPYTVTYTVSTSGTGSCGSNANLQLTVNAASQMPR